MSMYVLRWVSIACAVRALTVRLLRDGGNRPVRVTRRLRTADFTVSVGMSDNTHMSSCVYTCIRSIALVFVWLARARLFPVSSSVSCILRRFIVYSVSCIVYRVSYFDYYTPYGLYRRRMIDCTIDRLCDRSRPVPSRPVPSPFMVR